MLVELRFLSEEAKTDEDDYRVNSDGKVNKIRPSCVNLCSGSRFT